MKITKLDVSVAILAGLACLGLLINVPVWALFVGWAWYFVLGATPTVFKQTIPAMLMGYVLASIAIVAYAVSSFNIWAMVIAVGITVFILMLSYKASSFNCALSSFNAYSCMFAGYYSGSFPKMEATAFDWKNIVVCVLWIALANILGLVFGFVSVKLGSTGKRTA